ncbi:MAG: phage portal protein [Rickettsiaceae bacterium H1]|nr:phage portal protein [Rickettsiaceae bacterium H1]
MFNLFNKKNSSQTSLYFTSQPQWSYRGYYNFANEGYQKNVIAFRSINMIAIAISSVPFLLYKHTKSGKIQEHYHPLLRLLQNPNSNMSKSEFMESIVGYRLISGNSYIMMLGDKTPNELHLLRPDRIEIIKGNHNIPLGYRYKVNNKSQDFIINQYTGRSKILHLKTFNPLDDWYGLSPLEAASYSIDQHNQSGAWNQSMLQNGARPSGALITNTNKDGTGGTLDFDQYKRLKEQIDDLYSGSANAGRPLLLEGGLEWKEMGISPRDMDFINSKHSSARDIALAFGVPPQLLGIPGDNTYSNLVEARLALWEQTILPTLDNIIDNFNRWLTPCFGNDLKITYNKEAIEVLTLKREKLWRYVENANFMTINEKREAFGLPKIKEGEKFR